MVILDWNNISQYYCIFDQTNANTGSKLLKSGVITLQTFIQLLF